jgi:hypothetical protein
MPKAKRVGNKHTPRAKPGPKSVKDRGKFRLQLQCVYELAVEMSHCSSYAELDDDGHYVGRDPDILEALNAVRKTFRLKGEVEQ